MSAPVVVWLTQADGVAHLPHPHRPERTRCDKFWGGRPKEVSVLSCQVHGIPVCGECLPEVKPLKARAAG